MWTRSKMASSIGRAAQHGIISGQGQGQGGARATAMATSIGKKDYLKTAVDDEEDGDGDYDGSGTMGGAGGYSIDPSVQMWKTIAIPRNRGSMHRMDLITSTTENSRCVFIFMHFLLTSFIHFNS